MPKITNSNGDLNKAFFGTAEVEKIFLGSTELYSKAPAGYTVTFDCSSYFYGGPQYYAQYSLDNGTTWTDFRDYETYTITDVTQIKFRVYGKGPTWPFITAPSLSLVLESDGSSTVFTSTNYTLSHNISDVTVDLYFD